MFKNIGFGFHLLIPAPAQKDRGIKGLKCAEQKQFVLPKQEIFNVVDKDGVHFKIGIPCTLYPETFVIRYFPLGKTLLGG